MDKEYDMRFGRSDTTSFSNKLYFMRGRQYDSVYGSNHMLLSRPVLNDIIVARNAPNVPVSTEGSSNASTAPTESDGNTIDVSTAHSRYVPTNISSVVIDIAAIMKEKVQWELLILYIIEL